MTAGESLLDEAIELALVIDQLAQNSFGIVLRRLNQLSRDLAALTQDRDLDPTAVRIDTYRRARLEALIARAGEIIAAAYREISGQVADDLYDVSELSQDSLSVLLALLLGIKGLSRRLDEGALESLQSDTLISGATTADWWERQSADMQFRTARALQDAMRLAQLGREPTPGDLVDAIRDTGPGSLFTAAPRNAQGLIRSAFHAIANRVRFETGLRHPEIFRSWLHLSIIDSKTTEICLNRANRLWSLDGTPIGHRLVFVRPPLHFSCRSHIVPITHQYRELPPRLQRRIIEADFDGKPPTVPSLSEWLGERNRERDDGPIDYPGARRKLGL
jgi:hypothetical protein